MCNEWSSVACNRTIRRLFRFLCFNKTFLLDNNIQEVDIFTGVTLRRSSCCRNGSLVTINKTFSSAVKRFVIFQLTDISVTVKLQHWLSVVMYAVWCTGS